MSIIVQKFGGTSVADPEKIVAAARKAIRETQSGHKVVVVVSAMGHNTDMLIDLAHQITDTPHDREMDMLLSTGEQVSVALMAMAIQSLGHRAVSLTGAQIGIRTDSTHTKARIKSISTDRVRQLLDAGNIVIAAGFQGIDEDFNITTLGRGGSDTTAVALAAVLDASCHIYTDVDGVYTTDPRILPEARKMIQVSYDEMLELASLGAGVMHSRSIEFAKKFNVPIEVRSSFSDVRGTLIVSEPESAASGVSGMALTREEARITIEGVPDRPGASLAIFSKIARKNIAVDMIVQNVGSEGRATISFTVLQDDLQKALVAVRETATELEAGQVTYDEQVAKVSAVGLGMAKQTGIADRMFRALSAEGINILAITTSEIKISVLTARSQSRDALRAVHRTFELQKAPSDASKSASIHGESHKIGETRAAAVATRLALVAGMEDLTIDDIALDEAQARVTLAGVPDVPGVAAQVFDDVAKAGVFVDMIVQSVGREGHASVSFTVPRTQLSTALAAAEDLSRKFAGVTVSHSPEVSKLSVSGIGMRSHVDVAIRMFESLSNAKINVEMINTSEVRVNVVVNGAAGKPALKALESAFAGKRR